MKTISKANSIYSMDKNISPVAQIQDGEEITFETYDCFENQLMNETDAFDTLDWDRINPATGPVYIEGAEPGDAIKVSIQKIEMIGNATLYTGPDAGVMGDELTENTIKIVPIQDNALLFSDTIHIPINKMIGVIGTAPSGDAVSCGTPDSHGGNMDCKEITEGVDLFLPVNVSGALLALGDCHAAMGDGEVSVCGAEIPAKVTVKVTVKKNNQLPLPYLVNDEKLMTIASQSTVDEACTVATKNMMQFVNRYTDLSQGEGIHLLSLAGDVRICQIVDPNKTVRFELPLKYLTNWKD